MHALILLCLCNNEAQKSKFSPTCIRGVGYAKTVYTALGQYLSNTGMQYWAYYNIVRASSKIHKISKQISNWPNLAQKLGTK